MLGLAFNATVGIVNDDYVCCNVTKGIVNDDNGLRTVTNGIVNDDNGLRTLTNGIVNVDSDGLDIIKQPPLFRKAAVLYLAVSPSLQEKVPEGRMRCFTSST